MAHAMKATVFAVGDRVWTESLKWGTVLYIGGTADVPDDDPAGDCIVGVRFDRYEYLALGAGYHWYSASQLRFNEPSTVPLSPEEVAEWLLQ